MFGVDRAAIASASHPKLVRGLWLAASASALLSALGFSNDSSAELSAGGLVLTRNEDIQMRSEDLYISANQVRVKYIFFNKADRDVTIHVAFPMPDVTFSFRSISRVGHRKHAQYQGGQSKPLGFGSKHFPQIRSFAWSISTSPLPVKALPHLWASRHWKLSHGSMSTGKNIAWTVTSSTRSGALALRPKWIMDLLSANNAFPTF